jgi:hypothetical protein
MARRAPCQASPQFSNASRHLCCCLREAAPSAIGPGLVKHADPTEFGSKVSALAEMWPAIVLRTRSSYHGVRMRCWLSDVTRGSSSGPVERAVFGGGGCDSAQAAARAAALLIIPIKRDTAWGSENPLPNAIRHRTHDELSFLVRRGKLEGKCSRKQGIDR